MPIPSDVECATGDCGCSGTCAQDAAYDRMRDEQAEDEYNRRHEQEKRSDDH